MTKEEYEILTTENLPTLITVDDLKNKEDRKLIHGYTLKRHTFDIDLINGKIVKTITEFGKEPVEFPIQDNEDYIPSKRIYPESSDFEFCKLLAERGLYLPFTVFSKPKQDYNGLQWKKN